jgi:hypothetical protein
MTARSFNNWRVFPRLGMVFMSAMLVWFNVWFFQTPVTEMSEWHLVQYGVVVGAFIGLWKFYFETGKVDADD